MYPTPREGTDLNVLSTTLISDDPERTNGKTGSVITKEDRDSVKVGQTDEMKGEVDTESPRDSERTT